VPRARPLTEDDGIEGGVPEADERHVTAADFPRALGDARQYGLEIERGVDRAHHGRQQLGLAPPPARVLVEAGVLDGDRRLVGQEPGEIALLGSHAAAPAEGDDQRAHGLALVDQRQGETAVQIALLGQIAMAPARISLDVLDVLDLARGQDGAGEARVARHGIGVHASARELRHRPEAPAFPQGFAALVDPDVGRLRFQERTGRLGDGAKRGIAVGRRRDRASEPAERGQPLGALLGGAGAGGLPRSRQCRSAVGRALRGGPLRRRRVSRRERR
jgi:hypothetical protein